ncbi:MAG: hypothetical protein AAB590_03310 [Patescibacteria group bacterium]
MAELDPNEREVLTDTSFRPALKELIAAELAVRVQSYFEPLDESKTDKHQYAMLLRWHRLGEALGYDGPVCWRLKAGYTLKHHAPRTGACYKNWEYLQDWVFQNDEPTKDSSVYWIPRLVSESTSKNVPEQLVRLGEVRTQYGLPEGHLSSFGSGSLLSGLILAHQKRTGERVPLEKLWCRTDTLRVGGYRFILGDFGETGLFGAYWDLDGVDGSGGVFPLGVELIKP